MKNIKFRYEFVEFIPRNLEESVLYISIAYGTANHKCACGCGNEVVTPLSKRGWSLTYDGDSVSLYPSIGNWNLPCKSHYWITENYVRWSTSWRENENFKNSKRSVLQKLLDFIK